MGVNSSLVPNMETNSTTPQVIYQQGMKPCTAQKYWKNRRSNVVSRMQLNGIALIRFADGAVIIKDAQGQVSFAKEPKWYLVKCHPQKSF